MSDEGELLAGRYRLVEIIGRGGMGVVWRARDELIGRDVAVKQVHAPVTLGVGERAVYQERALAEARNAGRISHSGVVSIHDIVPARREGEAVSLVMELITAPTLEDVIRCDGPVSPSRASAIALRIWEALETAHAIGVVHRDVKPANIHLLRRDEIKLVDFGIAHALDDPRLTHTGVMGTGAYMAPELFDGHSPSAHSDWWSLGVTLRHIVTGGNVFCKESPAATMRAILFDPVPGTECPPPLSTVIDGLLTRDPSARLTGAQACDLLATGRADAPPPERDTAYREGGTAKWPTGATRVHHGRERIDQTFQLLRYQRDALGHDHPDCLATRHDLACLTGESGDFAAAVTELEQLRDDRERVLGTDHPDTLDTRFALAWFRGEANDFDAAAADLDRLLRDSERVLGTDHPATFRTRIWVRRFRGELDPFGAVLELTALLPDVETRFGPDDPLTLDARFVLAFARRVHTFFMGPERAVTELDELLRDSERVYGPDHRRTFDIRDELACLRGEAGDPDAAVAELERLLQDRQRVLGPDHPDTFGGRCNLAKCRGKAGDPQAAVAELARARDDAVRVWGAEHFGTLDIRGELACLRGEAGDPDAAVAELERLLRDQERVLGPGHVAVMGTRQSLAKWRGVVDGPEAGVVELEDLVQLLTRTRGPRHVYTLVIRLELALDRVGIHSDGDAFIADVEGLLPDLEQALGPEHYVTLCTQALISMARFTSGADPAAGTTELERALAIIERVSGPDDPMAHELRETIASASHGGQPQDAPA